jgi:hypothetical protein
MISGLGLIFQKTQGLSRKIAKTQRIVERDGGLVFLNQRVLCAKLPRLKGVPLAQSRPIVNRGFRLGQAHTRIGM